jgi:hypothetical protein
MTKVTVIRKLGFPNECIEQKRWIAVISEFPELTRIDLIKKGAKRIDTDSSAMTPGGPSDGFFFFDNGQICVYGSPSMLSLVKAVADKLEAQVFAVADDECPRFHQLLSDFANVWPNKPLQPTVTALSAEVDKMRVGSQTDIGNRAGGCG